jgi:shikimate kinase
MGNKSILSGNIILIGFMGTGKSSVSKYLSDTYGLEEVDVDKLIEDEEGRAIADIFKTHGEEYFRDCESNMLSNLKSCKDTIISCGGGAVLRNENVEKMEQIGKIVLLTADPNIILERVKESTVRPILNNNMNVEFITQLMEKRRKLYEEAASIIISTDFKSIKEVGEEIISSCNLKNS